MASTMGDSNANDGAHGSLSYPILHASIYTFFLPLLRPFFIQVNTSCLAQE